MTDVDRLLSDLSAAQRYARSVCDGTIPSNRWVRLACQRHLDDMEDVRLGRRGDIYFSPEKARRFYQWCRQLKHYKGPATGARIELSDWQKFVFGCAYGWMRIPDGPGPDVWRFNYVYIEVPRKNGKTTVAAACAGYDTTFVEKSGAEVYCLATKEDQAKILCRDIETFIARSEASKYFEVLRGRNTIYSLGTDRTSFVRPLGANSERLDGLNPLSAFCDELHEWPTDKLWDVMENAFGARSNWHMISITTAGHNKEAICWKERANLIDILEGREELDNKFGVIYTVDDDQRENWQDEAQWHIANPELGNGKQLETMRTQAKKASQMPSKINDFKNKQLDIWTDVAEAWLAYDDWKGCASKYDWAQVRGMRCKAGMDLARVNDLSAVGYYFPVQHGLERPRLLVDFYHPEDNLKQRTEADKVSYDLWIRKGWLRTTPGNTTDFKFILHDILERAKTVRIEGLAYDRHFAGEIVNSLQDEGVALVDFGMGFVSMGAPTAELERMVVAREIEHNDNPVLNWNASNVVVRRDPAGNIKPDKDKSPHRIDGMVACIMALGLEIAKNKGKKRSPYNRRGMRSL